MNTTLFLCGDVMTGRGIDQIFPYPSNPILYEDYVKDAKQYIKFAEGLNGPINWPVHYNYIWGDALAILETFKPSLRMINLETSITTSSTWANKGINYRMHPKNTACLSAAKIDFCSLANNHILDWGEEGLLETINSLQAANIKSSGAGIDLQTAQTPAVFNLPNNQSNQNNESNAININNTRNTRIIIFSIGSSSSGIPPLWKATNYRAGVDYVEELSLNYVASLQQRIAAIKKAGDIVIVSIHWGSNWGYHIPREQQTFARALIDEAQVDIVYGHSSHHFKGLENYKGKLILYGCGDFINDYEGIIGYEEFRSNLVLMYFPTINLLDGKLVNLKIVPLKLQKFCLNIPSEEEIEWVYSVLNREVKPFDIEFNYSREDFYSFFELKL